jgi:exopolyphosphatase / guanosine-5'-triphosphate,3'-diphosphate pyrophosphatase
VGVRRACIDIGSNTTRLLVAECAGGALREVHQEREFTRIGRDLRGGGLISPGKIAEVVEVVRRQSDRARELDAAQLRVVATAAIRRAANGGELAGAVQRGCGLAVHVLSGEEEARLAFLGACGTMDHDPPGPLAVVDVGGGSCELAVGRTGDAPGWSASLVLGSGDLADDFFHTDPPTGAQLRAAHERARREIVDVPVPAAAEAVAVGGSATSLRRLAGGTLDSAAFARALDLLGRENSATVAERFALDRERVRLLPAGLVILQAVSRRFGLPLQIGYGGVREGILLEGST